MTFSDQNTAPQTPPACSCSDRSCDYCLAKHEWNARHSCIGDPTWDDLLPQYKQIKVSQQFSKRTMEHQPPDIIDELLYGFDNADGEYGGIRQIMKDAAHEINRLRGLCKANGIDPGAEYICRCGLRKEPHRGKPSF